MDNNELKEILEHIAIALEKIANFTESISLSNNFKTENKTIRNQTLKSIEPDTNDFNNNSEEQKDETENKIERFLHSKNIKIKNIISDEIFSDIIDSLSLSLGKNYNIFSDLLSRIKSNMQRGDSFTLSIKEYPSEHIHSICEFCLKLHEIAFLEQYKYYKSPHCIIKAKTSTLSVAQNFFSGKWLERYVFQIVKNIVDSITKEIDRPLRFSYLTNPQVMPPNGNDFELDLIFCIENIFYWVESKTNDFQLYINKYSKVSRMIGLDNKHSIMVLPDVKLDVSNVLTSIFNINVCKLSEFETYLTDLIKEDLSRT